MGGIIPFMIGSIWTITVGVIAIWAWIWVKYRLEEGYKPSRPVQNDHPSELGRVIKPVSGGPIKVITPQEIKDEKDRGFIHKMKEIIE